MVGIVAVTAIIFRYLGERGRNALLRALVEKDQPLPPGLLQETPGSWDPRRFIAAGMLLIGLGVATALFGVLVSSGDLPGLTDGRDNLVLAISLFPFCLGGACYPEGHIETPSRDDDLRHLKAKVDAGLDFIVTQIFFDNAFFFDFVERARRNGINVPIVPGIMPITNFDQLNRFIRLCVATVPMRLALQLEMVIEEPEAVMLLGVLTFQGELVSLSHYKGGLAEQLRSVQKLLAEHG
jgi:hypothetical protein